ncbi:PepSY domain-containing protein [Arthrobacter sp. NPDC058192]|uniref:PepSY domain-containing protein n=1 Tax=Arthrobacter sp. NPDC058192 TaxID=3346372 RepID=UPI0036E2F907
MTTRPAAPGCWHSRAARRTPTLKDQDHDSPDRPPAPLQDTPPADPRTTAPADSGWFRAFLLRIHFYAGILAGPFLLIAAITGGLYAVSPQLEQALYSRELHVPAVSQPPPLSGQVQAAVDHADGAAPVAVRPPGPGPEDTARVLFADPARGESQYRTLFVDPGTGEFPSPPSPWSSLPAPSSESWAA